MYQLELAGLEIFHKLYFPDSEAQLVEKLHFPDLTGLTNSFCSSLLSLIIKYCPRQHVFGVWKEKKNGMGCMKPMWKQREETAISSTSHPLYFVLSCERETIVLFHIRESREQKRAIVDFVIKV